MSGPTPVDGLSPAKRALLAVEQLRARLEAAEASSREPIAIIGLACRFPGGADTPERFWSLLRDGVDAIREVPPTRWDIDAYYDPNPDVPGKMNTRCGAFLDDVAAFDAAFFGIAPREAMSMDPQQRLLLEVSWEALERSGQAVDRLEGSDTGVFIGISSYDYGVALVYGDGGDARRIDPYTGTGNVACVAAGRVSYCFGFQGPNVAIDTACSSSLVAVHLACQSLRLKECGLALAGGVNLTLTPDNTIYFSKLRALAPDGRCKAFDASANGFVRGEGCGVVVLKRLPEAVRDGDPILAVIRGSAINQDGRSSGLTVPNAAAQRRVIRAALEQARIEPHAVGYVEAHGTGTPLGDPIEVRSLAATLCERRPAEAPLLIGSVKTNIGHLESAAGVAGLIKVVLALQHEAIPPSLHFTTPNPYIPWAELPVAVPTTVRPWPAGDRRRVAGVSSFGFSGTNAHVVVEEAPPVDAPAGRRRDTGRAWVLPVSARSEAALVALAEAYGRELATTTAAVEDICYTASVRRSHHDERLAVVGRSAAELAAALTAYARGEATDAVATRRLTTGTRKIAFVFPGQGSHALGIGRDLFDKEPAFREVLETCDRLLRRHAEWSLLEELWADADRSRLGDTSVEQPVLFAIQVALAALWRAWGVEPDVLVGMSRGEVAAAAVAGALSLEDAVRVIYHRGRLQKSRVGDGKMAAVALAVEECEALAPVRQGRLSVAAVNSPGSTILSGDAAAIDELLQSLTERSVFCRSLNVDFASHCAQMDAICGPLVEAVAGIQSRSASIPIVSTVTGAFARPDDFGSAYWARNIRERVRFAPAVDLLLQEGTTIWLEVGPHPVMAQPLMDCLAHRAAEGLVLGSLSAGTDAHTSMLSSLAALYASGCRIEWHRLFPGGGRFVPVPAYPFQRKQYWIGPAASSTTAAARPTGRLVHPLLGYRARGAGRRWVFENTWSLAPDSPLVYAHVFAFDVIGAAAFVEMAVAAAQRAFGRESVVVQDFTIREPLVLDAADTRVVQATVDANEDAIGSFEVLTLQDSREDREHRWTRHATATVAPQRGAAHGDDPLAAVLERCGDSAAPASARLASVESLRIGRDEALARLRLQDPSTRALPDYQLHPGLIEAAQHILAGLSSRRNGNDRGDVPQPVVTGIQTLRFHQRPENVAWLHVALRPEVDDHAVIGDARLFDDAGTPLATVEGLRLEPAVRRDLLRVALTDSVNWLYRVGWRDTSDSAARTARPVGQWLILADDGGTGAALARVVEQSGGRAIVVGARPSGASRSEGAWAADPARPEEFTELLRAAVDGAASGEWRIVDLWSLNAPPQERSGLESLQGAQLMTCGAALHLLQAAAALQLTGCRIWLVTRGAQPVNPSDKRIEVAQAPLWSFGRVVRLEHPDLFGGLIDLGPVPAERDAFDLFDEITARPSDEQVAYRNGRRYIARLERLQPDRRSHRAGWVRPDATYLIVGGMGGLGLQLASWLTEHGARNLVLMGRRRGSPEAQDAISRMERRGVRVRVAAADATARDEVADVLKDVGSTMPPLRGVFYTAGTFDDGVLLRQDWSRFERIVGPTIQGAWVLHELTLDVDLDVFVLFSSAVSVLGNYGQANYAAAKGFLGALAHHRRSQELPAVSIEWGQWAGVGMAASPEMRRREDALAERGIATIRPDDGFDVLELLPYAPPQVAVVPIHWPTFVSTVTPGEEPALLRELVEHARDACASKAESPPPVRATFSAAPPEEQEALMVRYLRQQFARVLRSTAEIPTDRRLLELGMDSVMLVEVINAIRRDLQLTVYPREVYERPTVGALARYLVAELARSEGSAEPPQQPGADQRAPTVWERVQPAAPSHRRIPGVVFVLSTPRAGSTLLRVMLAGHSRLFAPPELHLLPFDSMQQRRDALDRSHLAEGLQRAVMELLAVDAAKSSRILAEWTEQDLPIQEVYSRLQAMAGTSLLVDKSPTYGISLETLKRGEALFDGAKYIHLVRHPYAAIESFVRLRMDRLAGIDDVDPYTLAEQVWTQTNRNVMEFFAGVDAGRWCRVYYERLVTNPERVLREVCAFLGVDFEEATLTPYEGARMTDGVHAASMPISDPNFLSHTAIEARLADAWRAVRLPRPLGDAAGRLAAALNYELPSHADVPPTGVRAALAPPAAEERFVDAAGLRLCVTSWGPERAPLIVCVHGILDHGPAWEAVAGRLVQRGYRISAPDLRGHGRSAHVPRGASYHMLDFVADFEALIRALVDEPFVLVGHSLGAALTATWASVRPEKVRALVLVEPLLPPAAPAAGSPVDRLTTHLDYLASDLQHPLLPSVKAAAERLRHQTPSMGEAMSLRMATRLTVPDTGGVRWRWDPSLRTRSGLAFSGEFTRADYLAMLRSIRRPVTVVFGDDSGYARPRDRQELLAALAGATVVELNGGHNLHVDAADELAELIAAMASGQTGNHGMHASASHVRA